MTLYKCIPKKYNTQEKVPFLLLICCVQFNHHHHHHNKNIVGSYNTINCCYFIYLDRRAVRIPICNSTTTKHKPYRFCFWWFTISLMCCSFYKYLYLVCRDNFYSNIIIITVVLLYYGFCFCKKIFFFQNLILYNVGTIHIWHLKMCFPLLYVVMVDFVLLIYLLWEQVKKKGIKKNFWSFFFTCVLALVLGI